MGCARAAPGFFCFVARRPGRLATMAAALHLDHVFNCHAPQAALVITSHKCYMPIKYIDVLSKVYIISKFD